MVQMPTVLSFKHVTLHLSCVFILLMASAMHIADSDCLFNKHVLCNSNVLSL